MSRLNAQQAASFPESTGRASFLSLANDKDFAVVRFAYNTIDDILNSTDLVHDVMVDGRNKHVDCLKSDFSQPNSVCPLCASGMTPKKVLYFNVRNEQTGEMQIWQRSESYFKNNMLPLFQEYTNSGTPLCSIPFKIVRNGAKGDTQTKYIFIAQPVDNMQLEQFPDDIDVRELGIIKEYNFQELQNYINTGVFPENQNNNGANNNFIQPREGYQNMGQPARVENYQQPMPVNNNRRTIMNNNNGGY